MSDKVKLFHLHFYCKAIDEYESFLINDLGFTLLGRYSAKEGLLSDDYNWDRIKKENVRLRLVELQKGSVNIVLMPGKFWSPKLEHFGFLLESELFNHCLEKAKELGLRIQERPNRTFISTGQGFRIEIHCNVEGRKAKKQDQELLNIENLSFQVENTDEFFSLLEELFGLLPEENTVQIGNALLKAETGDFGLKSFQLNGSDLMLRALKREQVPNNFPLTL